MSEQEWKPADNSLPYSYIAKGPTREELIETLREVAELIEEYVDVVDGDLGLAPNAAMRATMLIKEVLGNE